MRIGILTHNYPPNPQERKDAGIFVYDFVSELAKKEKVFVFCPDFQGKKEKYIKAPVYWFKWGGGKEKFGDWNLYNPISIIKFFRLMWYGQREIVKFVQRNKVDILLSCWTLPSGIFAIFAKLRLKTPFAIWCLGSDLNKYAKIPILKQLILYAINFSDIRFANSHLLCNNGKNLSGEKFIFLPAITNIKTKVKLLEKRKNNKFNFLYVGRLEYVKGVDILLKAANLLANKRKDFVINILGDGSMTKGLHEDRVSLGLEKIVVFHGWADERKVSSCMTRSDSLIIPSRSESLPLVLLEAANFSLPIIATDVGDCKRLISQYNIGITVPKENHQALSEAMNQMINSSNKFTESLSGFKSISKFFSQKNAVNIFLNEVKKL